MSNLPLKPLKWFDYKDGTGADTVTVICEYTIYRYGDELMRDAGEIQSDGDHDSWVVAYYNRHTEAPTKEATGFATSDEAKTWAWNHYNEKMQPYVKPDSITDIANWFKAAKPEPTDKNKTTQLGCVVEEFAELMESVGLDGTARELQGIADELKGFTPKYAAKFIERINKIDALDATSDITVTAQGFNQLMGFDGLGAQREVIRSNNSKMVNGKFEYDENGKIQKPDSYSEPKLDKFVGGSDD